MGSNHEKLPPIRVGVHENRIRPQTSQLNVLAPEFQSNSAIENFAMSPKLPAQGKPNTCTQTAKVTALSLSTTRNTTGHTPLTVSQSPTKVMVSSLSVDENLGNHDTCQELGDLHLQCQDNLILDKKHILDHI